MNLPTVIRSKSNERVKALREGFRGKASRPGELVSLEGPKLLEEALKAGLEVEALFVREGLEAALGSKAGDKLFVLSEDVFASAVDTQSPQAVAALVRIPPERTVRLETLRGASLLAESVQDPGNLGTLLRSAEAFGAEAVFVAGESVNSWSPKVMRASAGSVFRVPIVRVASVRKMETARHGVSLYAAMAQQAFVDNVLEDEAPVPVCVDGGQ